MPGRVRHSDSCSYRLGRKDENMKLRMLLFAIAVAGALALSIGRTDAQDKAKSDAKPAADMQEMMKKWMAVATPGEGHKLLEPLVGKWDIVTRMWVEGPNKPP